MESNPPCKLPLPLPLLLLRLKLNHHPPPPPPPSLSPSQTLLTATNYVRARRGPNPRHFPQVKELGPFFAHGL